MPTDIFQESLSQQETFKREANFLQDNVAQLWLRKQNGRWAQSSPAPSQGHPSTNVRLTHRKAPKIAIC